MGTIEYDGAGTIDLATESGSEGANYGNSMSTLNDPFWNNTTGDTHSWYGESNATGSSSTGPSAPQSGDDYIYVETSSGYCYSSGNSAILLSDAITQSGVQISFYYNGYGSQIDHLALEYSTNGGSTWTTSWSVQNTNSNTWVAVSRDLSAYAVTHLRFVYTRTSSGWSSDMALDNINVTYSGTTPILTDNYYNLEIDATDAANTGILDIDGDLTIASGATLNKAATIYTIAGSYINSGGTFTSTGGYLTFDGTGTETCAAFSNAATRLKIEKTSGGSVTTTGNSDFDYVYINSGSYIIDGETITNDNYMYVQGGTLKITSGLFHNNTPATSNMCRLSSGTIDIDGGELRIGNLSTTRYPDIYMTGGTIDISGGNLNIADALYSSSGTITQTGGNIVVGGYTGSSTHSSTAKLYKSSGTINFTGGTFAVKAQYPSASYYSLQITSGVTVNSNANHTMVLDPSGENMYMDLNGKTLGTMTINNSGSYSVFARDNFTLLGDLTINASGKLESYSSTGDITLNGGNFVNNGTFDLNSSDMTFTGSGNVNCGAITSNAAGTLVMNKTSTTNIVTLVGDVELKKITLTSGLINPDGNDLTIINSSPGSVSSYVAGPVTFSCQSVSSEVCLPTGKAGKYRPTFIDAASTSSTTFTAEYNDVSHSSVQWATGSGGAPVGGSAPINHIAAGYWWDVERNGTTQAKVGFDWDNTFQGIDDVSSMIVAHYNSTTSQWENIMGSNQATGTVSQGSMRSALMNDFSPFGGGSSGPGNPLPVDLLSFNTTCSHDLVDVDFTVLSQINNDYFLVERSEDAVNWEVIGNIDGAGNTNTQMDYNFVDANPLATEGYYRLTQVDFDNKSETFWPVITECSTENTGLDLTVYPNPVLDHFTIEIDLEEYQGDDVYYTILDIRGSIVKEDKISLTRGFNKHEIQIEDLSTGAYMLRFTNTKNHIKEQRIMVK